MLGECFDARAEFSIHEHCRPHWSQAGSVVFLTFRTRDSIPKQVLQRWELERQEWIKRNGFDHTQHWTRVVPVLEPEWRNKFNQTFNRHREDFLDSCHGQCLLQRRELALIVAESLLHFDHDRYLMGDFVIMPNHVHLLCVFKDEEALIKQ